jgi:hypothetical protein
MEVIFTPKALSERNVSMKPLTVYPGNKKKLAALKACMKALDIPFEEGTSPYDADFVAKIEISRKQINQGKTREVDIAHL